MTNAAEVQLTDPYDVSYWFGPEIVGPKELVVFQIVTTRHFAGRKLVIPENVGVDFLVHDIVVAGASQAVSANPIPAPAFSERAMGVSLGLGTNAPNSSLDLIVSNTSDEPKIFVGFIEGTEWDGDPANKFRLEEFRGQKIKIDENPRVVSKIVHRRKLEG
jgi:hypothetical protein